MTNNTHRKPLLLFVAIVALAAGACQKKAETKTEAETTPKKHSTEQFPKSIAEPLVTDIYTADPSAHVFENRLYIYPSHDIEAGIPENDNGDHFDMRDYHILSMDSVGGPVTDHGVALDIKNIPWARRQLWAPDAAFANNTYYLYFPVKNKQDVFQIGVATSTKPE